ncbi:hypothetical protein [Phenylobacterium sp.]|uniref:hypothetical protein n=1 Tax=Phenylobacterium sp. TaxID=1871053 RepID=UPI003919E24F
MQPTPEIPPDIPSETGRSSLLGRERLKRMGAIIPVVRPVARYVPKNPVLLIGAAALGVAGVLAWRNRRRIAEAARPMLESAAARGQTVRQRLPWRREAGATEGVQESLH